MTPRDTNQGRVYAAEDQVARAFARADQTGTRLVHDVFGSAIVLPVERKFGDLQGVQAYVDRVLALNWVQALSPRAAQPVKVRARKGNRRAHYESPGIIAVPPRERGGSWAMREFVVLHEIAHHLDPEPGHGESFVRYLLALVDGCIGPEAAMFLRFTLHGQGIQ